MMATIAKRNVVLAVIAACLGGWLVALELGRTAPRAVEPLIPGFNAASVQTVVVTGKEGNPPVVVHREPPGGAWQLPGLFHATASRGQVESLLSRIGALTTLDRVTSDPAQHAEYGLVEGVATRVTLRSGADDSESGGAEPLGALGGAVVADLWITVDGAGRGYARLAEASDVFRIPRFPGIPDETAGWLDRSPIVPYESVQIRRVHAVGDGLGGEVEVRAPANLFDRVVDAAGNPIPPERAADLHRRLKSLFPLGVVGRLKASSDTDTDGTGAGGVAEDESFGRDELGEVSFRMTIELRTGASMRLAVGAFPTGQVTADSPPVLVLSSKTGLVAPVDARSAAGLREALVALRLLAEQR